MKVYIAGPMTGIENDNREAFFAAQEKYFPNDQVMNPAILPSDFEHGEYIKICKVMIDICDVVFFMIGWEKSKGAVIEHGYALMGRKKIVYEKDMI